MQTLMNSSDSSGGISTVDQRPGSAVTPHREVSMLTPIDHELLVRRCMGRIELAQRLLASFETRFPTELAEIENSIATGDSPNMLRQIHQLKGAASNVSASALQAVMTKMEEATIKKHDDDVRGCLGDAHREWDRFKRHVASLNMKQSGQNPNRPAGR